MQFDNEIFDTDNCYDNSTNYRFTPTTSGKYFVYVNINLDSSTLTTLDQAFSYIRKNGTTYSYANVSFFSNYASRINMIVTAVIEMNGSTDYLEGFGRVNNTSGTPRFSGSNTVFGAYKIIE